MGLKYKPVSQKIERIPPEQLALAIKTRNFTIFTWVHGAVMGVVLTCMLGVRATQNLTAVLLESFYSLFLASGLNLWGLYISFNSDRVRNRIIAKPKPD